MNVLQARLSARLAMCATHNCLTTDRPDLPRAPDTGWTTDFSKEIKAIDDAIFSLVGELHKCPECGRCSTDLLNVPRASPAKDAPEPQGTRLKREPMICPPQTSGTLLVVRGVWIKAAWVWLRWQQLMMPKPVSLENLFISKPVSLTRP